MNVNTNGFLSLSEAIYTLDYYTKETHHNGGVYIEYYALKDGSLIKVDWGEPNFNNGVRRHFTLAVDSSDTTVIE